MDLFCTFRTFLDVPIGHVMKMAGPLGMLQRINVTTLQGINVTTYHFSAP